MAFQENYGEVPGGADSRRVDIPKDKVRPEFRRIDGVKYFDVDRPEYVDPKPIRDLMNRFLKAERKL